VHLTKQKAAHEICSLLFSLVLSTFSLPLLHADVHVDTTTMSLENTIQCTILGFYCSQCKTAMNKDSVRKHLQRNHLELIESMSKSDLREFLTTTADAVKSTSIESCLVGPIKRGLACSTCHTICSTKSVFTRHSTAGKCVGGKLIHISFRDTTCFRQHIINQPIIQATHLISPYNMCSQTTFLTTNIQQKTGQQRLAETYSLAVGVTDNDIPTLDNAIVSKETAYKIMLRYVKDDERPETWAVHFECLMSDGPEAFDTKIRKLASLWNEQVERTSDSYLFALIDVAQEWFQNYAYNQIKRIPANIRNRLVVFDSHEFGGTMYGGSFVLRNTEGRLIKECTKLLAFSWRYPSSFLDTLKTRFRYLVDSNLSRDQIIATGIVPKLLLAVYFEPMNSPRDPPPMAVLYCLSRCFQMTPQPLQLVDCQLAGTRIANTLHLLRAGLLGVLFWWPRNNENEECGWLQHGLNLVELARSCVVTNVLSPIIADTKAMSAKKPKTLTSTTDTDGNISIGQFVFERVKWRVVIPTVHEKAVEMFDRILAGDSWRDLTSRVNLSIDSGGPNPASKPIFSWTMNNSTKFSRDLSLKTSATDFDFNRLSALVQLIFHGLGTGAMRSSQSLSLETYQVQFESSSRCYYHSQSIKTFFGQHRQPSTANMVRHKVPPSLVWVVLLYRLVVFHYSLADSSSFVQYKKSSVFTMMDMVAEIFQLFKAPTALECRHLWTAISNIVDPGKGEGILHISATGSMARQSHHSTNTHSAVYATSVTDGEEMLFQKYHESLGEPSPSSMMTPVVGDTRLVNENSLLHALKILYGPGANFFSESQRQLVWHTVNGLNKQHIHASTSCGGGKSLAWILRVVVLSMLRWRFGMTIIVVPYNFLQKHLRAAAETVLKGKLLAVTMASIGCKDINRDQLPECLRGNSLPTLLFVSIDAFSSLLEFHLNYLKRMVATKLLDLICVDEVHTYFGEIQFRSAYDHLWKISALGCTVVTLSGTLPPQLIPVVGACLKLSNDASNASDMTLVAGSDPLGRGFRFSLLRLPQGEGWVEQYVRRAMEKLKHFLDRYPTYSAHVICSTIKMAEKLTESLISVKISCSLATSEVPTLKQEETAKQWYGGELRVLVSTTCGLVGNECNSCRLVLCLGNLYNACQLIQAAGRLRTCQRDVASELMVIAAMENQERVANIDKDSELLLERLRQDGKLLTECQQDAFRKAFGFRAFHTYLHTTANTCLAIGLCSLLGYSRKDKCENCSVCLDAATDSGEKTSVVQAVSRQSTHRLSLQMEKKRVGNLFLGRLVKCCIVCSNEDCDGVTRMGNVGKMVFCQGVKFRCFSCGHQQTSTHRSDACPIRVNLPSSRVCYLCFDRYDRVPGGEHKAQAGGVSFEASFPNLPAMVL